MADALTKLNGTWLQETVDGDSNAWFKYEGVGWMTRNVVWLAGYGNGKNTVDTLVHNNKFYSVRTVDANSTFRNSVSLTGKKEPTLFTESMPLMHIRQMEVASTANPDGSIEFVFYLPDGKEHSKVRRSVDEDGQVMTTTLTFPAGDWGGEAGGTCTMTVTSRKQEVAKLTLEVVSTWACRFSTLVPATESGVEGKMKAVSEPLEGMFPDAASMMKLLEETLRGNAVSNNDKIEEQGPGKFMTTVANEDGTESTREQAFDHEKHTFIAKTTNNGKCWGTWHYQAISEPLRLTCWNDMANEMWSTKASAEQAEMIADRLLAAAKK